MSSVGNKIAYILREAFLCLKFDIIDLKKKGQ